MPDQSKHILTCREYGRHPQKPQVIFLPNPHCMQRSNNLKKEKVHIEYSIQDEPIVLSKSVMDILLQDVHPEDVIGLYCFYYYTAKWQKTNHPRATTEFTAKALKWGVEKVQTVKKRLKLIGLIEDFQSKNKITNRIEGHYIHVNFIWRNNHPSDFPPSGVSHPLEKSGGNALSTNNIKRKNKKKKIPAINLPITPTMFSKFWKLYPKHPNEGKAYSSWLTICNKLPKDRPSWVQIKRALLSQKESKCWEVVKYIPHPTTWLNQKRWLDDPKEMDLYNRETESTYKEVEELPEHIKRLHK